MFWTFTTATVELQYLQPKYGNLHQFWAKGGCHYWTNRISSTLHRPCIRVGVDVRKTSWPLLRLAVLALSSTYWILKVHHQNYNPSLEILKPIGVYRIKSSSISISASRFTSRENISLYNALCTRSCIFPNKIFCAAGAFDVSYIFA